MKLCQNCGQLLAEEITSCPACGSEVREGRKRIDDYQIVDVLHEGYSSILCKAIKVGTDTPYAIRIFTPRSGVNQRIADRLKKELEELQQLPEAYFVRHFEIRKSTDGLWYRVSEWLEAESWGTLLASGVIQDYRELFRLFANMASILDGLHRIGHIIPHLILNDIIIYRSESDRLAVKIDYKVSRFLDPDLDRPGPMLKKLLNCHPDIRNRRPLDIRSDIWSLGKIFVELLSADYSVTDYQAKIEELAVPPHIDVLLKIMLADDPDLRPRSMAEVARSLSRTRDDEMQAAMQRRRIAAQGTVQEIKGLKYRIQMTLSLTVLLGICGILLWVYWPLRIGEPRLTLTDYANRYAPAVAFVLVDYWIEGDQQVYYQNQIEGTAFLVDRQGHLLTNRHVACPWLEDTDLFVVINRLRQLQRTINLHYRAYLWFEGQKAFKRLPGFAQSRDLADRYYLENAYRTEGKRRLSIAGVAQSPSRTWQQIKSPLRDDFAVLKIEPVPTAVTPVSLDLNLDPRNVPKLHPVIALGFPLGSRTQETTVNVSVTRGHVRRAFDSFLQVDTSIYQGNSGGPIIDGRGKVIGIASSVAVGYARGPIPIATPLSDMGMILPITKAALFLNDIKAGQPKWNGVLDLSIEIKLKRITEAARQRRWKDAQSQAVAALNASQHPLLVMAAAMMHVCAGDREAAARLFEQALSMDAENIAARFMRYLVAATGPDIETPPYKADLLALDWRSPDEFYGYLVRIFDGMVDADKALKGGYTAQEKSWLHHIVALAAVRQGRLAVAEDLLKIAVLEAGTDNWVFYLALAELDRISQQRLRMLKRRTIKSKYQAALADFYQKVETTYAQWLRQRYERAPLLAELKRENLSRTDKRDIMDKLYQLDPSNGDLLVGLSYVEAMRGAWKSAYAYAQKYLAVEGRENRGRLRMGLLAAELTRLTATPEKATASLKVYRQEITDPWYRSIATCLLAELSEDELFAASVHSPEYVLTSHAALGLWAEGTGDTAAAVYHYKEALGSYMDDWIEFEFTFFRIQQLKAP